MTAPRSVSAFLEDETGAITIDWVSLTAGLLLLGIAVVYAIFGNGVTPLVNSINGHLKTAGFDVEVGDPPSFATLADVVVVSAEALIAYAGGDETTDVLPFDLGEGVLVSYSIYPAWDSESEDFEEGEGISALSS